MLQERIFRLLQEVAPDFRVVVHTKVPGVVLPEYLLHQEEPLVLLQFGSGILGTWPPKCRFGALNMVRGVHATLSFGMEPFEAFIPWASIVAMGVPDRMDVGFKLVDIPDGPSKPPERPVLRVVK